MRKIIVAEFISVDGVVEAPERWHFPYVNEEMFCVMWALNAEADTMLRGRVTYQSFAGACANAPADDPVAAQMNKPAKVVVSKTLNDLEWKNSTLLTGDVVDEVAKLKDQPGAAILVTGVQAPLKLASCHTFSTGVVHLVYRKTLPHRARTPPTARGWARERQTTM